MIESADKQELIDTIKEVNQIIVSEPNKGWDEIENLPEEAPHNEIIEDINEIIERDDDLSEVKPLPPQIIVNLSATSDIDNDGIDNINDKDDDGDGVLDKNDIDANGDGLIDLEPIVHPFYEAPYL